MKIIEVIEYEVGDTVRIIKEPRGYTRAFNEGTLKGILTIKEVDKNWVDIQLKNGEFCTVCTDELDCLEYIKPTPLDNFELTKTSSYLELGEAPDDELISLIAFEDGSIKLNIWNTKKYNVQLLEDDTQFGGRVATFTLTKKEEV